MDYSMNIYLISRLKEAHTENNRELQKKLNNQMLRSNLIKIVINFLQVCSLAIQLNVDWPDLVALDL